MHRDPRPILDKNGRVFAVLAGRPKDTRGWTRVNAQVQAAFEQARARYKLDPKKKCHRRGDFPAVAAGISYGGGQKHVSNLAHDAHNQEVIEEPLREPAIQRVAGFANAAFALFAPRLYRYYKDTIGRLCGHNPSLKRNFSRGVFASATFNLGPQVITYVHTDHLNLPAGWCAITAVGDFDPEEGGHLLLWDLNLMIEFPPGALVLIPSVILRHSNTVVRPHERRFSFTQYSAGGLFRWVECGFKSQKAFEEEGGTYDVSGAERWLQGVRRWSTWEELRALRAW
ncbi:hypothetical protein OH77DRAFT_1409671 [Trametes cingulata]|nr:hypothetical protein OH77DRAFT_1409671 [Trametes cingulata]